MNKKRGIMWLLMGCVAVVIARFKAMQIWFLVAINKVSKTTDQMRAVFKGLFRKTVAATSIVLMIVGPALASASQDAAYDLFKVAIQPFLDLLIWPVIPAAVALSALAAFIAPVFGDSGEAAKKKILHYITWGVLAEVFLVIFWAFMKLIGTLGGHNVS